MTERIGRAAKNAAALAAALLIAELAARLIYSGILPSLSRFDNGRMIVELMADGRTTVNRQTLSHPYLLYTNAPGFTDSGFTQYNSMGYRNPEFSAKKPEGVYRILALGGSTTVMYPYIKDPSKIWTAIVERKLNAAYPGRRFEVINAGLSAATSAELLAGYVFRHRYLNPDLVIFHEGGNEVGALLYGGYHPEYTHLRAALNTSAAARPAEKTLLHSRLVRLCYVVWLRYMPSVYSQEPYPVEKLDRKAALERVRTIYPLGLERNLDLLIRLVKQDNARMLLLGFVQARKEMIARNRETLAGLEEAIDLGLQKNNDVIRRLSVKYGVPFAEPAPGQFRDEWFRDNCHLTEEGEAAKAEWAFAQISDLLKAETPG